MANIDRLLKATRPLEAALRKRGGQGRGLHGLVSSVEAELPPDLVKQIRWLATLRNKAVHEDGFKVSNIQEVEVAAAQALRRLGHTSWRTSFAIHLSLGTAKKLWLMGTVLAGAVAYLKTPTSSYPLFVSALAASLVAWLLHPARQPQTLALTVLGGLLATAVRTIL